jgi:hypothetical protein
VQTFDVRLSVGITAHQMNTVNNSNQRLLNRQ